MNDRLVRVFDRDFLQSRRGSGLADPAPIFILGLPRSGSTLLEQILASHSQVEGTSELPYLSRVAGGSIATGSTASTTPKRVSSEPRIFCHSARTTSSLRTCTGEVARRASSTRCPTTFRTSDCWRSSCRRRKSSMRDAIRSMRAWLLSPAKGQNFTYDLTEIGEYYLQYQRLMDHWADVLPGRCSPCSIRGSGRGLPEPGPPAARVLRVALGGCVSALLRERPASAHAELGAGAPADLRSVGRSLAQLRAAPR